MNIPTPNQPATAGPDLVITRTFSAPRTLVFAACTEPERLAKWWGPQGYTMQTLKLELRPGGIFHYSQRSPSGQAAWGRFVYHEIVPPERLVYTSAFADDQGNAIRAPFSATWPLEILNTWTFGETDGRTTLTMEANAYNATDEERALLRQAAPMVEQGMGGTLDQLEAYLASL